MTDKELQIQLSNNIRDIRWSPRALTWEALCTLLSTFEERPGKDGLCWSPVLALADTERKNQYVKALTVGVLDIDGPKSDGVPPERMSSFFAALYASGLSFVLHSTHTHATERQKVRVAFRLSRNVHTAEWALLCAHLIQRFGVVDIADKSTKTISRAYYLPSHRPNTEHFADVVSGQPLDVDEALGAESARLRESSNTAATQALDERIQAMELEVNSGVPTNLEALRSILRSTQGVHRALVLKVLSGKPIASVGSRDNTLNDLVCSVVYSLPAETPAAAIFELLRPSVLLLERKVSDTGQVEDWEAEALRKIERHKLRKIKTDAERAAIAQDLWTALRSESARVRTPLQPTPQDDSDAPGSTPESVQEPVSGYYTQEEVARWASEQGCDSVEEFNRRWIIQRADSNYVFVEGRYLAPVPRTNLWDSCKRDLARSPVKVYVEKQNGQLSPVPLPTLLAQCSTVARTTEASLIIQRSHYDAATHTFHEACAPIRAGIHPKEHPEIQLWLELLDPTGKLCDWVATVTRLDRYACAIYLDTKPGTGKNLLAGGLARLWSTGGPTELARILDGFNESLTACPLVFADESLPKRRDITATLRNLIGSTSRTLNRKFLPMCNLTGAVRLILAGNNDRLLDTGEELSVNDLAAIASRFLYLNAGDNAAGYLEALGGPPVVGTWINQNKLAEHALYLRDTRKVKEGARFIVEGDANEFHRHLATGSGMAGAVCEWITRYLADPVSSPHVLVGSGEVWVNVEALAKPLAWERYLPSAKVPSAAQIGRSLRALSHAAAKIGTVSFFRINADLLTTWIERLQIGDTVGIRAKLAAPNPAMLSAAPHEEEET